MNQEKLREAFLQGGEREASEVFNELMKASVRAALWEMMSSEVESLCGPKYHPKAESEYRRGGSEQGSVYLDGGKESVKRPRVRHVEDGEVELESYRAASSQAGLFCKSESARQPHTGFPVQSVAEELKATAITPMGLPKHPIFSVTADRTAVWASSKGSLSRRNSVRYRIGSERR